jgi:hypothetical protein
MGKHHVVPRGELWAVKAEGKSRASAVFATQAEAIAAAKKIASNQGGYVLIHRRDGTIRTERVEKITGTIKVDVTPDESLTVVQNKIERANKRLKALAAKVATKKKARDRKAAKKNSHAAKKPTAKKTTTKKTTAKKTAATKKTTSVKKSTTRQKTPKRTTSMTKVGSTRKASVKKSTGASAAKKQDAKKTIGGRGLKVILKSASKAVKKLIPKR